MDTLKQNGKKNLRIIFYLFNIGVIFNVLWIFYVKVTSRILRYFGLNSTSVRDFIGPNGYIIILSVLLFTIGYYVFTKKKIHGFVWIIIVSIILLVVVPIYYVLTHNWGVKPH